MFYRDFFIILRSYLEARDNGATKTVAGEVYVPINNNSFIRGPTAKGKNGWQVGFSLMQLGALSISTGMVIGYLLGELIL